MPNQVFSGMEKYILSSLNRFHPLLFPHLESSLSGKNSRFRFFNSLRTFASHFPKKENKSEIVLPAGIKLLGATALGL